MYLRAREPADAQGHAMLLCVPRQCDESATVARPSDMGRTLGEGPVLLGPWLTFETFWWLVFPLKKD